MNSSGSALNLSQSTLDANMAANTKKGKNTILENFFKGINRTKQLDADLMKTPLKRCLTTFDICLLGVGHMIGAGIYVLTGNVAKNTAGPAIIISFILAGFTSLLAALCYAEFGARVPKAGSAYVYTYVSIGEFWAFVIGWDVILEHMIGAASVARAWSGYLDDTFFSRAIQNGTLTYVGHMGGNYVAAYPDFLAFGICLVICMFLSAGVKGSSIFNTIFTMLNLLVIVFVLCVGFYFAKAENWTSVRGGFFPYGFSGVIAGAATVFYAFVGFDSIATSGEEAKTPSRSIPLATFMCMAIATLAYILMSASLTLMIPYYDIIPDSAFPGAFGQNQANWARYVVSVGALAGMTTTMFGGLFALPRCVYAMATDGLLFQIFAYVNPKTQTPIITLVVSSLVTATIALLFDIEKLVNFMSIGTLMAYTIVSVSVIILRYQPSSSQLPVLQINSENPKSNKVSVVKVDRGGQLKVETGFFKFLNSFRPGRVVLVAVLFMTLLLLGLSLLLKFGAEDIGRGRWGFILLLIAFIIGILLCVIVIHAHEQSKQKLLFKVPFVPAIPALSIFCNLFLMTYLDYEAWIRFAVWMLVGMTIYFSYGMRHSKAKLYGLHPINDTALNLPENHFGVPVATKPILTDELITKVEEKNGLEDKSVTRM